MKKSRVVSLNVAMQKKENLGAYECNFLDSECYFYLKLNKTAVCQCVSSLLTLMAFTFSRFEKFCHGARGRG